LLGNGSVNNPTTTDMQATIEELLGICFLFGLYKVDIKKSSVENWNLSSIVPSEQLRVEKMAL
jgi:hypothetical protein